MSAESIPQSDDRYDPCEECGGHIDTHDAGYYKTPNEKFKHGLCHEEGEFPGNYELDENHDHEVHTNRQYNCGHNLYAPPKRQPMYCPVCNDTDVEVVEVDD